MAASVRPTTDTPNWRGDVSAKSKAIRYRGMNRLFTSKCYSDKNSRSKKFTVQYDRYATGEQSPLRHYFAGLLALPSHGELDRASKILKKKDIHGFICLMKQVIGRDNIAIAAWDRHVDQLIPTESGDCFICYKGGKVEEVGSAAAINEVNRWGAVKSPYPRKHNDLPLGHKKTVSALCQRVIDPQTILVSGDKSGKICIYDGSRATTLGTSLLRNAHKSKVTGLVWVGEYLCSSSANGKIKVWDLQQKASVASFSIGETGVSQLSRVTTTKLFALTEQQNGLCIQIPSGEVVFQIAGIYRIAPLNCGYVAAVSLLHRIDILNEKGECVNTLDGAGEQVYDMMMSRPGTIITTSKWGHMTTWRVSSGENSKTTPASIVSASSWEKAEEFDRLHSIQKRVERMQASLTGWTNLGEISSLILDGRITLGEVQRALNQIDQIEDKLRVVAAEQRTFSLRNMEQIALLTHPRASVGNYYETVWQQLVGVLMAARFLHSSFLDVEYESAFSTSQKLARLALRGNELSGKLLGKVIPGYSFVSKLVGKLGKFAIEGSKRRAIENLCRFAEPAAIDTFTEELARLMTYARMNALSMAPKTPPAFLFSRFQNPWTLVGEDAPYAFTRASKDVEAIVKMLARNEYEGQEEIIQTIVPEFSVEDERLDIENSQIKQLTTKSQLEVLLSEMQHVHQELNRNQEAIVGIRRHEKASGEVFARLPEESRRLIITFKQRIAALESHVEQLESLCENIQ